MKIGNYGADALLVELASPVRAGALRARLEAEPPVGVVETMPGLQTVLVRFDPVVVDDVRLADVLKAMDKNLVETESDGGAGAVAAVTVRVRYTGADLNDVAEHTGLTAAQVIDAHTAADYRVALIGMAPGFYFLAGGDARLHVPRRSSPRTHVPRGAVGLAGHFTGIYPRRGPGGWQLIGQTDDDLWHPDDVPAALLAPGVPVRFTAA